MAKIKTIGQRGQVTLGKQFAGHQVLVEQVEPGVWSIRIGIFIPDNEAWLREPALLTRPQSVFAWTEPYLPLEPDGENLETHLFA